MLKTPQYSFFYLFDSKPCASYMVCIGDSDVNLTHWSPNKECISSNCKQLQYTDGSHKMYVAFRY